MRIFFAVIITILLLVVFITYGLDEHVLCVVLHNIRVFMKRLYATIKKLIQKNSANDMEWENGSIQHESLLRYRNFKENNTTREEKLLSQLITLEQDKNLLQEKNIEITTEYERKQHLAKDKIVSASELQRAKAVYENAKAVYETIKNNFSQSGQKVTSPIGGYVCQLMVKNGEYVEYYKTNDDEKVSKLKIPTKIVSYVDEDR